METVTLDPPIAGFPQNKTVGMTVQISRPDFIRFLDHSMTYSVESFVKHQIENSTSVLDYTCRDAVADFSTVLRGTKKESLIERVLGTIEHEQTSYRPCDLGGYIIMENQRSKFLRNYKETETNPELHYGFIDADKIKLFLAVDSTIKMEKTP